MIGHTAFPEVTRQAIIAVPAERALNIKIVELTLLMAKFEEGVPMLLQASAASGPRAVRNRTEEDNR